MTDCFSEGKPSSRAAPAAGAPCDRLRLMRIAISLALAAITLSAADLPRKADPLMFKTHDAKPFSLAAQKGKAVAVLFFSTECSHCQHTAQLLGPIYEQYKARGVEFCGVAVNTSAVSNIGQFAKAYNVKFPIGVGGRELWSKFGHFPLDEQRYVPHMLFVDKAGVVVEDHPGKDRQFWTNQEANIKSSLERVLKRKPTT